MRILRAALNSAGAYAQPQSWDGTHIPDGYYRIADSVDETPLTSNGGFVTPTIVDGVITAFTADTAAWEVWKAEHPQPPAPTDPIADLTEMTCNLLYEIDKMKLGVTES